ncbi:MAG TPA: hypothetical protein VHO69_07405 [Phototrophicaceae bacterium]|nr:hypothetical protein [Phototrophicaceae bacterium]
MRLPFDLENHPLQATYQLLLEGDLKKGLVNARKVRITNGLGRLAPQYLLPLQLLETSVIGNGKKQETLVQKLLKNDEYVALTEVVKLFWVLQDQFHQEEWFKSISNTVLQLIQKWTETIVQAAKDYPRNPIRAEVWLNGANLRAECGGLAQWFKKQNLTPEWADLVFAKTRITLAIMSHYHHEVGPAMLEMAEVYLTLNDIERAKQIYHAVILDFSGFIDQYQADSEEITPEDQLSLQSLEQALSGYLTIDDQNDELKVRLEQVRQVLSD